MVPIEVPEARGRETYFPGALPADLITELGRARFLEARAAMDPIVAARGAMGLEVMADDYNRLRWWRVGLCQTIEARFRGLDGWVTPTIARVALPVTAFDDVDVGLKLTLAITRATQPVNLLGLTATTTPIQSFGSDLPVGLQVVCPAGEDSRALAIALAIEAVIGPPPRADVTAFLA